MKQRRDVLSNMETMLTCPQGGPLTPEAAVEEINITATVMGVLFDTASVARTHCNVRKIS